MEFSRDNSRKDGREYVCKMCRRDIYVTNRENVISKSRAYYESNKDAINLRRRGCADKEKVKAANAAYREINRDNINAQKRVYYTNNKCKIKAANAAYYELNADKIRAQKRVYNKTNAESLRVKSRLYSDALCVFDHTGKLPAIDGPKFEGGKLTVLCKTCGKRFQPVNSKVGSRIDSYKGAGKGDCNLYCSDSCKKSCLVWKKQKWPEGFKPHPRELQGPWAKAVKDRDGYKCQRCDSKENLHAHHILPLATTYDAWLVENGITFCATCHFGYAHKLKGCSLQELRDSC